MEKTDLKTQLAEVAERILSLIHIFLLTTSAACYCALRHKWAAYAVWGCLSAMTRMTGFLVLVPAAVELLKTVQPLRPPAGQSLRAAWKALDRKIPLLLCPLLGTLSYLLLNFIVDGDAFAFVTHQKHWYQGPMWISKAVSYTHLDVYKRQAESRPWG